MLPPPDPTPAALPPTLPAPAPGRTLLVLGHGSHLNADSARAVHAHARTLQGAGFDEVLTGFWKEEPSLRQVLRTARYRKVTVLPAFISEGYFTEEVIPRELGLCHQGRVPDGGVTETVAGRTVHYLRPYGIHAAMTGVLLDRAREVCPTWAPERTALVVLGHGTRRNPRSKEAIEAAARHAGATGLFARTAALYLDEPPHAADWRRHTGGLDVIMVPFFASEGWHTLDTMPAELGLSGPVSHLDGRVVSYARPVGTHPAVGSVLTRLVQEAPARPAPVDADHAAAWAALATAAEGGLDVGELRVTPQPDGTFALHHAADAGEPGFTRVPLDDLAAWTGRDNQGEHRPIRTRRGLPRGWQARVPREHLRAALHAVYPAVTEEAHAWDAGKLPVTPWAETAARQSGRYRPVRRATPETVQAARERLCAGCLRTPLWAGEPLAATFLSGGPCLPCAEACTLLVSDVAHLLEAPHP